MQKQGPSDWYCVGTLDGFDTTKQLCGKPLGRKRQTFWVIGTSAQVDGRNLLTSDVIYHLLALSVAWLSEKSAKQFWCAIGSHHWWYAHRRDSTPEQDQPRTTHAWKRRRQVRHT